MTKDLVLKYTPFSPFARKVLVLAHERGIFDRLQLDVVNVGTHVPLATPAHDELGALAPLMKVPVLVASGEAVYDSRVICEYIDQVHSGPKWFPEKVLERRHALTAQALADGILDSLLLCRFELRREESQRWADWTCVQMRRVTQALAELNQWEAFLRIEPNIGHIAIACALGYIDFRFAELNWRHTYPALAGWFDAFDQRPSMRSTSPFNVGQ